MVVERRTWHRRFEHEATSHRQSRFATDTGLEAAEQAAAFRHDPEHCAVAGPRRGKNLDNLSLDEAAATFTGMANHQQGEGFVQRHAGLMPS